MYQIELCVPPWEQMERQIARSAVTWGQRMRLVFEDGLAGDIVVVAAHHEGNSLEVHTAVRPRPRAAPRLVTRTSVGGQVGEDERRQLFRSGLGDPMRDTVEHLERVVATHEVRRALRGLTAERPVFA